MGAEGLTIVLRFLEKTSDVRGIYAKDSSPDMVTVAPLKNLLISCGAGEYCMALRRFL